MSQIYDIPKRSARFHRKVSKEIEGLEFRLRRRLAELVGALLAGENLGLPVSRPMPEIDHGVHELRINDRSGRYRIFYYTKVPGVILIFHFYKKQSQTMPNQEVQTARLRLREML